MKNNSFRFRALVLLCVSLSLTLLGQSKENLDKVKGYFDEIGKLCARDGGRLWNKSMCVPFMFVLPQTREIFANQEDTAGILRPVEGIYYGILPEKQNIANTAFDWNGKRWTMVFLPVSKNKHSRARLFMHESFHCVQPELGFPLLMPDNAHLDEMEGRFWLKMEWHALRKSLRSGDEKRLGAVKDALVFREHRRQIYPDHAQTERQLEMNEGLAEYTGLKLSGMEDDRLLELLAEKLENHKKNPSYINSFAYWSGPAYGLLLDAAGADWRPGLTPEMDFGEMIRLACGLSLPERIKDEAERLMLLYDGPSVRQAELQRERELAERLAEYRKRLVDGPVLILHIQKGSFQFDPRNIVSLGKEGKVYPSLRISDKWGILTASEGALLSPNWSTVRVSAPDNIQGRTVSGKGWELKLEEGWTLAPGERKGDFVLAEMDKNPWP
jgi:hypothetical protein